MFKLTESIIFGVLLLAQSLAVFAPNFSRARHGAAFVLGLKNSLPKLYAVGRKFVDENKVSRIRQNFEGNSDVEPLNH